MAARGVGVFLGRFSELEISVVTRDKQGSVTLFTVCGRLIKMSIKTHSGLSAVVLTLAVFLFGCISMRNGNLNGNNVWRHSAVFIDSSRLEKLKTRILTKSEPGFAAWRIVKKNCDDGLATKPQPPTRWAIPGFYDDHEAHEHAIEKLRKDATLAYEEALCFRILNESRYAKQSAKVINAWASTLKEFDPSLADTKLSMNEFFAPMIVAADLLNTSNEWTVGDKLRFKDFIRQIILPLNTMEPKQNNHANWGVFLVLCAAAYTDDVVLFEKAKDRFKSLIDIQIGADGTMVLEYDRSDTKNWHGGPTKGKNGIWYSNYALMPITLAAEVLNSNGFDLYNYRTISGKSIGLAFKKAAEWSRHPELFPFYKLNHGKLKGARAVSYFEILNQHWPDPNASELLSSLRPLSSEAGMPHLTLTHGGF